ncbi:putative membrane fusion protein [Treponema primitia ZAS-2]|uniref:Putative membrane fusion protein n=1 Tax=Treponema primitia (strain ATCC BAA-887 / DSM 12427 / ZAS-2) TaxID=545694 RepID=F5YR09_TREPZ|nr:efflux RND transporter periplasmic adaptor subunit [Treponema primitia]AEF85008.1 putative membrane fusion protein [Treponema primitia ZAS-2]
MIKGDVIAKVIVIVLIAAFLGIAAFNMLAPKASPAMGNAPAGMPPGGNAPASGQRAAQGGQGGGQSGGPAGSTAGNTAGSTAAGSTAGNSAGGSGGRPAAGRPAANAITVLAKTLQPETIRQVVKLNGDVSSQSEVNVMPDTSGKITRMIKNLGDTVQRGEVIAYIDPSRAGQSYSENPVTSPVAGTISSLPVTTGSTVSSATVVAVVGSLDNLKITIYVAEKYSAYLRRGLPAIVSFTFAPDEEFAASVSSISPVVNNKNRTIETTLLLDKRDGRIKQGMFASVYLVIREENRSLVIPRAAVKNYNGDPTVYIIDENNLARRVPISLGLTNDSDAQVISGLKAGDRVITAGSVTDGSPVRIAAAGLSSNTD